MALFEGFLYRRQPTEDRELDPGWFIPRPATPAAYGDVLTGWPDRPIDRALAVPTIFRCVSTIATKIAKFQPYAVKADDAAGTRLEDQPRVLRRPDPSLDSITFWDQTATDILLSRAVWKLSRGTTGEVIGIETVRPSDVTIRWADRRQTRRQYEIRNQGTFAEGDVIHLAYLQPTGHLDGLSPIAAARALWEGQLSADNLARSNFVDGTFPSGVLKSETTLSQKASDELKANFMARQRGSREPLVLSGGTSFEQIQLVARDAQWIEHRQWTATDLARHFGVPAALLSLPTLGGTNLTYTTIRDARTELLHMGLDPVMCRIGAALERWVLPSTRAIRWDVSSYLPPEEAVTHLPTEGTSHGPAADTGNDRAPDRTPTG